MEQLQLEEPDEEVEADMILVDYDTLEDAGYRCIVIVARMSHWKWRESKVQPGRVRSGHQISCCLVSLHFLCDILAPISRYSMRVNTFLGSAAFPVITNSIFIT